MNGSSPLNGSKEKMAHRLTLLDRYSITIKMTVKLLTNRWVTWGPDPVVNTYIGVGTGSEWTDDGHESDSYCEERKVVKTQGPVQRRRLAWGCMNPLNQTKHAESAPTRIRIGNRSFKKVHSACQWCLQWHTHIRMWSVHTRQVYWWCGTTAFRVSDVLGVLLVHHGDGNLPYNNSMWLDDPTKGDSMSHFLKDSPRKMGWLVLSHLLEPQCQASDRVVGIGGIGAQVQWTVRKVGI